MQTDHSPAADILIRRSIRVTEITSLLSLPRRLYTEVPLKLREFKVLVGHQLRGNAQLRNFVHSVSFMEDGGAIQHLERKSISYKGVLKDP